jgi:hypothetical protein
MRTLTLFRSLIIACLVLSVAGACIDFIIPGLLPANLDEAYDAYTSAEPNWTLVVVMGLLMLVILIFALISTIGLLVLRPWARPMAIWTTILSFPAYPFLGAAVYSGLAFMLLTMSMTMWGAALAMTFHSELRGHFERQTPGGVT